MHRPKDIKFGERIRRLRQLRSSSEGFNISQTEIANKIGISFGTYQRYEHGYHPNRNNLKKIIWFYGCNEGWLLTGVGEPFNDQKQIDRPAPLYNKVEAPVAGVGDRMVEYSAGMDLKDKLIRSQEKLIRELEDRCRRQADKISALKASLEAIEKRLSGQAKDENTEKKVM